MRVSEGDLTDAREFLSRIGIWPTPTQLDLRAWLDNFDSGEDRELALALLEAHVHMNEDHVHHASMSAFAGLSGLPRFRVAGGRQAAWSSFLRDVYVSYPTSSDSDVTGSGHIFARALRDAGIDSSRIRGPADCVRQISQRDLTIPIVFVDDLAASGNQFAQTWCRNVSTARGVQSFEKLAAAGQLTEVFYAPVAATDAAVERIAAAAPEVVIAPAYLVGHEYSCNANGTRVVPPALLSRLPTFIEKYARASGGDSKPYGYAELGLLLSFHHGTPNNSLPIFQRRTVATPTEWRALIA